MSWVSLHVHSHYSILNAVGAPKAIVAKAKEFGMTALALTDRGNLFGAVEFYKACQSADIKSIIGCELFVAPSSRFEKTKSSSKSSPIVLLAKNLQGYHNLCKLSSLGYLDGFYYHPRIDKELLEKHCEGLICIFGNMWSSIASAILEGNESAFVEEIKWYQNLFGDDCYFELQRHQMNEENQASLKEESWIYQGYQDYIFKQNKINEGLIEWSSQLGVKCVATNNSYYLDAKDWRAHEILCNVQSGEPCYIWSKTAELVPNPKRKVHFTRELYFKSPKQISELFSDLPNALSNTLEIVNKCAVEIDFKTKHYPVYIPPSLEGEKIDNKTREKATVDHLWHLCEEGIKKRYTKDKLDKVQEKYPNKKSLEVIRERLNYEMSVIVPKGLSDYLLIVYDFIAWARRNKIPVGPGRGSGVGSIVLYLIGVTDIEPLRFNLFFERFINPERLSYPDIDVDICMERRNEVIDYMVQKYGRSNVAQIITFGTMKAKMAVKDVGRVLNVSLAKVNKIAKFIPEELNMTLDRALEIDADLANFYKNDEEVKEVIDVAKNLEGSVRNTSIHAAGLIVCGEPIIEYIPVCLAKDSDIVATQYAMKPVEAVGMLKIDFLGLKTLTSIQKAVDALQEDQGISVDWMNLALDDKKTFSLLNHGKTLGTFQIETGGMQELCKNLKIDKFEEIMAVISLYRPGPMDMIPSFIDRKHGREKIESDHQLMDKILSETYGLMVYQEQVMQVASDLANYSLAEGDVLRKAMGKKNLEEMARQRNKFINGAVKNNIGADIAETIFDKMERFAAYGFNKSHAAAYAYISYITAYLKAHYPSTWMAALMTNDRYDITKVSTLIREARSMGISILSPDVNESSNVFRATKKGIRFAMSAIKGIGGGVVESIVLERKSNGSFDSLYNFIERIDQRKVGRKVTETLIDAGCFDFTNWSRDAMKASIDNMYDLALQEQREKDRGIVDFFAEDLGSGQEFKNPPLIKNQTLRQTILMKEKELLGFFLQEHPLDFFKKEVKKLSCIPLKDISKLNSATVFRAICVIDDIRIKITSRDQRKFAILNISDGTDQYEAMVWPDVYGKHVDLLLENQLLYAVLCFENRDGTNRITVSWLGDLNKVNEKMICECDLAYDRAKEMSKRSLLREKNKNKQNKKSQLEKPKEQVLKISLDADKTNLSHILKLKKLFKDHPGEDSLAIDFISSGQSIGELQINKNWGRVNSERIKPQLEVITQVEWQRECT